MTTRLRAGALTLLLGAAAAVAVGLAVTVLGTDATAARATERTAVATKGVVQSTVSGSGSLAPGAEHDLSFGADGTVTKVAVKAGEHVARGQLLAAVDPGDAEVALAQAEADLSTARDALDAATSTDSASLAAKVDAAKLALADARDAVAGTKLYAPVAGTVADVGVAVGDAVTADGTTTAVTLVQLSRYKMTVALGEADIGKVKVGQPATVTVAAAGDAELAAKVTAVDLLSTSAASTTTSSSSSASDASAVSYSVTLKLTQGAKALKPGMSATAEIVTAQATGVTVPTQAISGSTVTVVKGGVRTVRQVQAGAAGDAVTQIVSGVSAGESVVVTSASATAGAGANAASTTSSAAQGGGATGVAGALGGGTAGAGGTGGPPTGGGAPGGGTP